MTQIEYKSEQIQEWTLDSGGKPHLGSDVRLLRNITKEESQMTGIVLFGRHV